MRRGLRGTTGEADQRGRAGPDGLSARVDGPDGRGRYSFPVYEDLTRANFLKMQEMSLNDRVQSCWSINGQLRFKLVNSPTIHRIASVFEPTEQILQNI
jgi:hypothetical protein